MNAIEDARDSLRRAVANTSPGDEGVYVTISDLETLLAEHERLTAPDDHDDHFGEGS